MVFESFVWVIEMAKYIFIIIYFIISHTLYFCFQTALYFSFLYLHSYFIGFAFIIFPFLFFPFFPFSHFFCFRCKSKFFPLNPCLFVKHKFLISSKQVAFCSCSLNSPSRIFIAVACSTLTAVQQQRLLLVTPQALQ